MLCQWTWLPEGHQERFWGQDMQTVGWEVALTPCACLLWRSSGHGLNWLLSGYYPVLEASLWGTAGMGLEGTCGACRTGRVTYILPPSLSMRSQLFRSLLPHFHLLPLPQPRNSSCFLHLLYLCYLNAPFLLLQFLNTCLSKPLY